MSFAVPSARSLRWSAWEGCEAGIEHVEIRPDGEDLIVKGVVIGTIEAERFGLDYRLVLAPDWTVREARLRTTSGRNLHLKCDGRGSWRVDGRPQPALRQCVDIDIQATPFTNTLPIRRLALTRGESSVVEVAWIGVPALSVQPARQRYTALEPGALYRFESLDQPFAADLPVDGEGLVLDYPGLFRRLPSF